MSALNISVAKPELELLGTSSFSLSEPKPEPFQTVHIFKFCTGSEPEQGPHYFSVLEPKQCLYLFFSYPYLKHENSLTGQCHDIFDLRFFFIKQYPLGP
jgi:hypothetical protein